MQHQLNISTLDVFSNEVDDHWEIKEVMDVHGRGFREKDIELIMSVYAPDAVAYYEVDSLQISGREELRKFWEDCLSVSHINDFENYELKIRSDENLAFCNYLSHIMCVGKDGKAIEHWSRCTLNFIKVSGKWMITHEHTSVPFNAYSGKTLVHLCPKNIKSH